MPKTLSQLKSLRSHVSFLTKIGSGSKAIDARDLMSCADNAKRDAMMLKLKLSSLAESVHGVTRKNMGDAFGTFMGNYRGNLRNINREFFKLQSATSELDKIAAEALSDPGRWGDAAADTAVAQLTGILNQLMEFWAKLRVKEKLSV